jgi:hypothetical protein
MCTVLCIVSVSVNFNRNYDKGVNNKTMLGFSKHKKAMAVSTQSGLFINES